MIQSIPHLVVYTIHQFPARSFESPDQQQLVISVRRPTIPSDAFGFSGCSEQVILRTARDESCRGVPGSFDAEVSWKKGDWRASDVKRKHGRCFPFFQELD